ncbi:MAG: hypothetical protein R2991_07105 [Thermoanaerobaculia bacterium]
MSPHLTPQELAAKRARLPSRLLPLLYWGLAHVALATAFAVMLADPRAIGGFYYHPAMVGVVHLVTLGWITASILGALYLVAPMALRAPLPAGALDVWGWVVYAVGVSGMVSHFWLEQASGMAWSAAMVLAGLAVPAVRFWRVLATAPIPAEVKLHFRLAFVNLLGAATMGLLLGVHKAHPFLPGYVLGNVWAHAHLAALGWATMMVMAAGYRLLPMFLPAAMPEGRWVRRGAWTFETGVVGLFVTLLGGSRWSLAFALLTVAGIGIFLSRVAWMRRHRRPAPKGLRRPDLGVAQALLALAWMAFGALLGLALAAAPPATWKLPASMVYGVAFLVGFLSQIVVGIASRLAPLYAWLRGYSGSDFDRPPPSPHALASRPLQAAVLALWGAGVPALAGALAVDTPAGVRIGAGLLLTAVVLGALQNTLIVVRASRRAGDPSV